jgi:hypothetical protein
MQGSLSRILFPNASRRRRWRRVISFCLWLLGGLLIIGIVVGVLYVVYQQALL